ncbi:MAG: hypothetical protein KGY99_05065 [Phycisphaerae bacterium]|nr:hypothetical protein [Phycisphaerae bacterium]
MIATVLAACVAVGGCGNGGADGLAGLPGLNRDWTQTPDGQYTILLKTFSRPSHVRDANYYKDRTLESTNWQGLNVVHAAGRSELYWGRYASIDDAQRNLKRAKVFQPREGAMYVYGRALVVPVPGEDPGPPTWDLLNATGTYTVVVAKFYNLPRDGVHPPVTTRKRDAVEYCRRLRDAGVAAYYYHGPANSLVTIGTFGRGAVVSRGKRTGPDYNAPVQFEKKIRDPRMVKILKEHPKLAVNGREEIVRHRDPKTGEVVESVSPSYPMEIPEKQVLPDVESFDRPGDTEPR